MNVNNKKAKVLLDVHREHITADMTDADMAAYFSQYTSHSDVIDAIVWMINKEQQDAELERYSEILEEEEDEEEDEEDQEMGYEDVDLYTGEWENFDDDEDDQEEGDF